RTRRAALERTVGALEPECQVLHPLVELVPPELETRAFRAGLAVAHELAHVLVRQPAQDLGLDEALRQALAEAGVGGRRPPVADDAPSQVEHVAPLALEPRAWLRAAPLVGERRDDDRPSAIHLAAHVRSAA